MYLCIRRYIIELSVRGSCVLEAGEEELVGVREEEVPEVRLDHQLLLDLR